MLKVTGEIGIIDKLMRENSSSVCRDVGFDILYIY